MNLHEWIDAGKPVDVIVCCDCLSHLRSIASGSINCLVTSPPYWGLRDYGVEGQIGLEPTFHEYIAHLMEIFAEVRRVLRDDGTCWVNLGDSYSPSSTHASKSGATMYDGISGDYGKKSGRTVRSEYKRFDDGGIKQKSLCQIPSRFAIAMTDETGYVIKNKTDAAWVGGIIEGEGCITIAEHRGYYEPRIQVAMVCRDVLEKIERITGVGSISKQTERNNPKWNDSYIWKVAGKTAANICADIFPYLVSKQENARIVWRMVQMQDERPRSGGDKYSQRGLKYTDKQKDEQRKWFEIIKSHNHGRGIPTGLKDPEQNTPWILRNTIIWYKRNAMPASVKDRFTVDFEKVFFFTKQKKYWFEQQKEQMAPESKARYEYAFGGEKDEHIKQTVNPTYITGKRDYTYSRNMRCVWDIPTTPCSEAHFAVYPEALVERMIAAGCPEGGVVCDPFSGSGTTMKVALRMNRHFIGSELNAEYIDISGMRTLNERMQLKLAL